MRQNFNLLIVVGFIVIGFCVYIELFSFWFFLVYIGIATLGLYDMQQTKHTLWRNYPIIGRFRWVLEELRPPIRQYFIESDIDGVPFNRETRGVVYRRSKNSLDTIPFGTKKDLYKTGYEWIAHSLHALQLEDINQNPRVMIGGKNCKKPYASSLFNISAMSFGALSSNAILALGQGAKLGSFAFNTGEGGISSYHLETNADLIWQIGTGYFGCRDTNGNFDENKFRAKALLESVKMIEIKLSQGAKPGHGGILPAHKNTPEIATQRELEPYTQVNSPPTHSAFTNASEMMLFIQKLQNLSEGKPVGFKMAMGVKEEFVAICKAIQSLNIVPDFITIDGGEGGTGAAPLEYTNHVGMPLRDALIFVIDTLNGYGLKKEIKVCVSGRVTNGMDIAKNLSLGADFCASARGMMFSLGCIQSLQCHKNTCPTGIATQNKKLSNGIVVKDKKLRVQNYHKNTVESFVEIIASAGLSSSEQLTRKHIYYRTSPTEYKRYDQLFIPVIYNSYTS